jgi:prefoldin subunit 5
LTGRDDENSEELDPDDMAQEPVENHLYADQRQLRREFESLRRDFKEELAETKREVQRKDHEIDSLKERISNLEMLNKVTSQLGVYGKWGVATLVAIAGVFVTWLQVRK